MLQLKCISLLLLFTGLELHAQYKNETGAKRCPVTTINYEQGLVSNSINGVITDGQGLTWVSTSNGIQRYNGYTLQLVNPVIGNDTIHINYPVFFLKGKTGSILIGYKKGILEYDAENNSFRKIISIADSDRISYSLMPLKETVEGIWCFEQNKGVVIFHNRNEKFDSTPTVENHNVSGLIDGEEYNISRKLVVINNNFLFVRASINTILQINTVTHQSSIINYPESKILGLECDDQKLFVASYDGISYINIADRILSKKILFKLVPNVAQVSRFSIQLSSDHHLLVSVERQLYEIDISCSCKREIISLTREPLLNSGYIQIVYEDPFQRIWLLTNEDIKRIQNAETPFGYIFYPNQKDRFEKALYYDNENGNLVACTYSGSAELYDSAGNTLWNSPLKDKRIINPLNIEKISKDHYLLITGQDWYDLNSKEKKFTKVNIRNRPDTLNSSYYNNVQRIDDSIILIGTKTDVLRVLVKKDKFEIIAGTISKSAINNRMISCFVYTSDKSLWAATLSGSIIKIDSTGKFINVPIAQKLIRVMVEDDKHRIWAGTDNGIYVYNTAGQLTNHFTRNSGLLSEIIYSLEPADKNRKGFFASTHFGLSYISDEGKIINYTREMGLQENEFNTLASTKSSSGKLFFGGVNGITAFYPSYLSVKRDSSEINITRFMVNDSLYNLFGGAWEKDSIRLPYNRSRLQFDIAASGLLNPNEYVYNYRMRGSETNWQTTNQPTNIRYSLQPGTYTLEINCSPILFSTNTLVKKIAIIIDPPWWETWWAIVSSTLISILIIFGISYYIIRERYRMKLRKLEISQQLVNERERISRELHDNIGSQLSYISSNIDWLVDMPESFNKEDEKKRLSVVNDTAKNLVDDLRETIWAMKKESINLDELADKLKSFLQSQFILHPQVETVIHENIQGKYKFSPTEALNVFRICQEAISNSFRHSQAEKIFLTIQSENDKVYSITIEDNGKGFVRQQQYNGHYGLENMTNRARESGAKLVIDSAPLKGTKISVSKS
ncbi:MAG: hypothetical protein JST75_14220 [Bacteroidetes bacterium]|nr:hypothetical protein [Bacteroidota bacterium]